MLISGAALKRKERRKPVKKEGHKLREFKKKTTKKRIKGAFFDLPKPFFFIFQKGMRDGRKKEKSRISSEREP